MSTSNFDTDMRIFIIKVISFSALALMLLVLAGLYLPNSTAENHPLLRQEIVNQNRLRSLTSPKMVLVGGSNVSHGFDSKELSQAFNLPVVNMGVYASFGIIYQLRSIKDALCTGDVVVLMPEYAQFDDETAYGDMRFAAMLTNVKRTGLKGLDIDQIIHILPELIRYGAVKICGLFKSASPVATGQWYNDEGDCILSRNDPMQTKDFLSASNINEEQIGDAAFSEIQFFASACKKKGAVFVVLPPNMERCSYEKTQHAVEKICDRLRRNGTPFAVETSRYVLDRDCFYDTQFHLNNKGRSVIMPRRIEDIRGAMK